ncbi:MAG: chromosome segregation protein SMC [Candidatus Krumholzibacteriales bacterium]
MALSNLELIGFKSFKNRIGMSFSGGVTCILGPNGCGKTNIVDAVRWVLGERSAQQLRSNKMENVIFNGTQVHKPMGHAIVNLTLSNERGIFPLDFNEVTVSRKVYRSGISEYFINKNPCRLKDIMELFADTGMGSHSYAVIEQEMMDLVLNDTQGDRKKMFEEAAGIVKYRMRREEARRKLKLTETDLVRLDDILEELEKQKNSLRYQVGKTTRYRKLKSRIRDWELILVRSRLSRLLAEKREEDRKLSEIEQLSSQDRTSMEEKEREVHRRKVEIVTLEKRSTELQNNRYDLRKKIQGIEEKLIQMRERRGENERRCDRAEAEIKEAENRIDNIKSRIGEIRGEFEETEALIEERKQQIRGTESEYIGISEQISRYSDELIGLKQTQLDFVQDRARLNSDIEHHQASISHLDTQIGSEREEVLNLEKRIRDLTETAGSLQGEVSALNEDLEDGRRRKETLSREKEALLNRLREIENSISGSETNLAKLRNRLELYTDMMKKYEGFSSGSKFLLRKGNRHIRGPVAELMDAERKYRKALEAALGGMLDGIVVDGYQGAVELIEELESSRKGGVGILVEAGAGMNVKDVEGAPGALGRLSSFVRVKGDAEEGGANFFRHIMVFDNLPDAIDFVTSNSSETAMHAVTLSGVYLSGGGKVYFSGKSEDEVPLLGRAEEVEKIKRDITGAESELRGLKSQRDDIQAGMERAADSLESLGGMLSDTGDKLSRSQEMLRDKEKELIWCREKYNLAMKSLEDLENTRKETLSHLEEVKLSLQLQHSSDDRSRIESLEEKIRSLQEKKDRMEESVTGLKVELASLKGSYEKKEEAIRGQKELERQFATVMENRKSEISSLEEENRDISREYNTQREIVGELLEQENEIELKISDLADQLEEKRNIAGGMEAALKREQKKIDELVTRANDARISVQSLETKMNDAIDMARDIYGEDFGCYLEGVEIPLTEKEKSVTPDMLQDAKDKLERLGPVNLAAVEEYEEIKERLEFINGQREDLIKAKEELREAISKINRKARRLFRETFKLVGDYFSQTFEVLFTGGHAELRLSENCDPLEADIEIVARPKGKKLQDISLLSGGERALTSLALLFAFYKVKPSPFCILDEVDAPLDDANTRRFTRMLKKFSEDTQFIIITHNKITMEIADSLLGITMQESGVTSVVPVDIERVEDVLNQKGAAGEKQLNQYDEKTVQRT